MLSLNLSVILEGMKNSLSKTHFFPSFRVAPVLHWSNIIIAEIRANFTLGSSPPKKS